MPLIVVEQRIEPGLTPELLERALARNAWCRDLYGVTHHASYIERDGERMICVFRAPDAEAVRAVARRMGYRFERVWAARHVGPDRRVDCGS